MLAPFFGSPTAGLPFIATNYDTNAIGIGVNGPAQKALVIRGAGLQTANLQEWQNDSGTVLANMSPGGTLGATNIRVNSFTSSGGGGAGIMIFSNATTVPTSNPTGGGILYSEAGALKWRGSSGTVTTIANA